MYSPLVSIIIPCYNSGRWLNETIMSAEAQTWPRKEIIVVDDGSTDESLQIAQRHERRGVTILSQRNQGAGAARNNGFKASHGDLIQYLDADDLLHPEKLQHQIERLKEEEGIACGRYCKFKTDVGTAVAENLHIYADMNPIDWLITSWAGGGFMQTAGWLTPRAIIEQAGLWMSTPCPNDDGEFFTRALLKSRRVLFCPSAISYYRIGLTNSLASRTEPAMLHSLWESLILSGEHLLAAEDTSRTRAAICQPFRNMLQMAIDCNQDDLAAKVIAKHKGISGSEPPFPNAKLRPLTRTLGWRRVAKLHRALRASARILRAIGRPERNPAP